MKGPGLGEESSACAAAPRRSGINFWLKAEENQTYLRNPKDTSVNNVVKTETKRDLSLRTREKCGSGNSVNSQALLLRKSPC